MIICGDALTELKKMDNEIIDCCITSHGGSRMKEDNNEGYYALYLSIVCRYSVKQSFRVLREGPKQKDINYCPEIDRARKIWAKEREKI